MAVKAARAQDATATAEDYPNHQVTFIVPFAPAGGTDILARLLAEKLELAARQTVCRREPSGRRNGHRHQLCRQIAARRLHHHDGRCRRSRSTSRSTSRCLTTPTKDLALVALIARVPFVLVVNPSLPVNSVEDLIKLAKKRPLSYGSGGIGAFHHLAAALFLQHDRHQDDARALPRHGAGAQRSDRRLYPVDVQRSRPGAAADQCRENSPACGDDQSSASRRCPTFRRSPRPACLASTQQHGKASSRRRKTPQPILAKLNSQLNAIVGMDDVRARMTGFRHDPGRHRLDRRIADAFCSRKSCAGARLSRKPASPIPNKEFAE